MSVLDRSALSDSPLADLHAIASELSIDGYRRLRRPELIDAILAKQGAADVSSDPDEDGAATAAGESTGRRRRGRRGGRGRSGQTDGADTDSGTGEPDAVAAEPAEAAAQDDDQGEAEQRRPRGRRADRDRDGGSGRDGGSRGARREGGDDLDQARADEPTADEGASSRGDEVVEGVVELLANGSGFVRVKGPDASSDDVYISAAQVKRCELVSGDKVSGPKRDPRRSERYASMIRIETINGRPAAELADSVRFDDLPAALPNERIVIGSDDPTLEAIEWLTPFGRGSRVTIVGGPRAGKSEAIRRLATALADADDLTLLIAFAGVRPEEISEYVRNAEPAGPLAAAVSFAGSHDAAGAAVEPVIDQARRLAARGAHAVVLLDTLDGLSPHAARKLMASARNIVDGGSVTIVATATAPVGGETTVIALDPVQAGLGRFPALDLLASGALRPELLVGEAGAEAIARTRAEVLDGQDADDEG